MHRPHDHFLHLSRALIFLIVVFFVCSMVGFAVPVHAQQTSFEQFADASTLPTENIAIIVARVIRVALSVVGIIFTCLVIYAGYLYFMARGETKPIEKAKTILKQAVIGLLIIFSAYSITTFILNRLLDAAYTGTSEAIADAYAEPLSGSLGGGILDDHYPKRNATDIARNTNIFISFKEEVDPASVIADWSEETPEQTGLNTESILIYPTDEGVSGALKSADVVVTYNEARKIFVFNPVGYLGSSETDTNYTVYLTSGIELADGTSAFTGSSSSGYAWTFEVSTEIDLTPPYITSVVPRQDAEEPRNVTIEVNFSEAMDPVATTGAYIVDDESYFTNIQVEDAAGAIVEGTFEISNAYRTISFTTTDACGEDPCGDTIYCLPTNQLISSIVRAATINEEETPQAEPVGYTYDGVVDAAANSLDGDNDGDACGSTLDTISCVDGDASDDYEWTFTTTDEIEDTVPQIMSGGLDPDIEEGEISTTADVQVTFNTYLKSSTLNTSHVSLWPDPYYEFWFAVRKSNNEETERTTVEITHPALVSTDLEGWDYYPVLTHGIKSAYQICMYPAIGPGVTCGEDDRDEDKPYCCNGYAQEDECQTPYQESIEEYPVPSGIDDYVLPDNSETEL
jgi:hypothetical protein